MSDKKETMTTASVATMPMPMTPVKTKKEKTNKELAKKLVFGDTSIYEGVL